MREDGLIERARRLLDLGAEMLVCSKIQSRYKEWLIRKGIAVGDNKRAMVKGIIQRRMESIA